MSTVIITDSCSDVSNNNVDDIIVVKIPITMGEKDYSDCEKFREEFFSNISNGVLPKTSQVAKEEFLNVFNEELKKGNDILAIILSSKMSGTYNSAMQAKKELNTDKICVIDSETASTALMALCVEANKMSKEGKPLKTICQEIEKMKSKVTLFACIYDISFLIKNGRLKNRTAYLSAILNIKPVITIENGEVVAICKCIGMNKAHLTLKKNVAKKKIDLKLPVYFGYSSKKR